MIGWKAIAIALALVLLGATLGQVLVPPAQAGNSGFTECAAASLYPIAGKALNKGKEPRKTVKVPAGWEPVGGAGVGSESFVILCR